MADSVRVEVQQDCFGFRFLTADGARRLAAALVSAADMLDGEVVF